MAQEKPSTPEKQLLNLIEDPKEQDLSQKKIKRNSFNLLSVDAVKGRLSFLLENIQTGSFFKKALFDIKGINKILQAFIVFLVVYIIWHFSASIVKLREEPEFISVSRELADAPSADFVTRTISDYLDGPRERNIFSFGDTAVLDKKEEVERVEEVAPPEETILSRAEQLAQSLGLVGIGWSDDPDVMIRNMDTDKMYFLKRGDRIDGVIKVEAIFEDKVILTYEGKEMELR